MTAPMNDVATDATLTTQTKAITPVSQRLTSRVSVVSLLALAATLLFPAAFAHAAGKREGDVVVVNALHRLKPLSEGSHDTAFSLRLPTGATCPGDSMNDDWRVQTFVIPSNEDPGALRYAVTGPEGPEHDARVSLYTTEGRPYVNQLLGANTAPGQPGQIVELPPFSFKRLPVDYLPSGTYRVGIACTDYQSVTAKYWDTLVQLTASPKAMHWTALNTPNATSAAGISTVWIVVIVAGAVVLLGGAVLFRRARARGGRTP